MKILAVVSLLLVIALGVVGYQLKRAHQTIGQQSIAIEQAIQTAENNRLVYDTSLAAKDSLIAELTRTRLLSEQAAAASMENEKATRVRMAEVERSLRKAAEDDEQSAEWAVVRVPDAVIDGMHSAEGVASAGAGR
jgi:hypothetical protein